MAPTRAAPRADQRGGARPQPPGGTCDIGAVEFGSIADVGVSQIASPSPVAAGELLTYTVTVTNGGPGPDSAAGTMLADTLPAGASLVSATPSQGSCTGSAPVSCALGSVASGASAHVAIAVRPTVAGVAINSATVNATPADPNPANNLSQAQATVFAMPIVPIVASPTVPILSNLAETAKTWREGRALARITARQNRSRLPIGTTFSFGLNVPASVTFTFTRVAGGRKVGAKCLAQTNRNKLNHRCTRTITAGTLTFSAHAGTNKVRFQGVISKHKALKAGSYTLLAAATASSKHSTTRALRFRIASG